MIANLSSAYRLLRAFTHYLNKPTYKCFNKNSLTMKVYEKILIMPQAFIGKSDIFIVAE